MVFDDSKITEEESKEVGIVSQPDTLNGSAAENKAVFDALPNLIIERLNLLIDALHEATAAAELGATPFEGVEGETVQQQITDVQDNLTALKEETGAADIGVVPFEGVQATTVQGALQALQGNLTAFIALLQSQAGAAKVGATPFDGMPATDVQSALQVLQEHIDDIQAGVIPAGSITWEQLTQSVKELIDTLAPARASSELDDYLIETGTFENAGAGWNTFKFRTPFDSMPVVTVSPEEFVGFCEVKQITSEGFLYCLRLPGFYGGTDGSVSKTTVYTGSGTGTSPSHSAVSLASAVVLPTLPTEITSTTAEPVKIHYTAIEYGGDM